MMNLEDECVKDEIQSFEEGRVYAIQVKDIKKFSYTNLNEPYYDLPRVIEKEKTYGKVYTPMMLDYGMFIERLQIERGVILA